MYTNIGAYIALMTSLADGGAVLAGECAAVSELCAGSSLQIFDAGLGGVAVEDTFALGRTGVRGLLGFGLTDSGVDGVVGGLCGLLIETHVRHAGDHVCFALDVAVTGGVDVVIAELVFGVATGNENGEHQGELVHDEPL